jgi:hypothetical protein
VSKRLEATLISAHAGGSDDENMQTDERTDEQLERKRMKI